MNNVMNENSLHPISYLFIQKIIAHFVSLMKFDLFKVFFAKYKSKFICKEVYEFMCHLTMYSVVLFSFETTPK